MVRELRHINHPKFLNISLQSYSYVYMIVLYEGLLKLDVSSANNNSPYFDSLNEIKEMYVFAIFTFRD